MKAVIMAGGEGSRLRPLTCDLPKPMARLCGRPILEYILDLLGRHSVTEASLTLRYLPEHITKHFPDGKYKDMELTFVREEAPLGTAGSARNACADSDDGVLVISGDAMCDFDLSAFAEFHKIWNADATILGKRVADPREYGLIRADAQGNITGFIEKPAFSQAVSDIANTGIYLLSDRAIRMIPDNRAFDFAKDLFPLMLEQGMKLMCWQGTGYWCDIGDLYTYLKCQRDMLDGLVQCDIVGRRDTRGNIFAEGIPTGRLHLDAPVYIGKNVRLDESALIERGSVIDDGCCIGGSARVSGSILLPGSYVGARAKLTQSLVCGGGTVKDEAMLFEGAAVGAGAVIGEGCVVQAGVKVWPNKMIPPHVKVERHVKESIPGRDRFDEDGMIGQVGVELTPEFCARVGAAVGSLYGGKRIAVGCGTHESESVLKAALCAGIQSTGCDVIDLGENFQAHFEFSMNFASAPVGVYIRGDSRASLRLIGAGGLPATREMERDVENLLAQGDFARCTWEQFGSKIDMQGFSMLYKTQLVHYAPKGLTGCRAQVKCRSLTIQNLLRDILMKLGCDTRGGLKVEVSSQGDKVRVYDPALGYIPHHKVLAYCAMSELERGVDVAVPFDTPLVLEKIAEGAGRRVLRYFSCPADNSDMEARKLARVQMWSRDGLMQAILFLDAARRAGGIEILMRRWPEFDRAERVIEVEGNPAGLIRELDESPGGKIGEGVLLRQDLGIVMLRPLKRGTALRVFAEARSSETADELCADVERMLRRRNGKE